MLEGYSIRTLRALSLATLASMFCSTADGHGSRARSAVLIWMLLSNSEIPIEARYHGAEEIPVELFDWLEIPSHRESLTA